MAHKETAAWSLFSVLILALVCSVLVSAIAVGLRPKQEANEQLDRKKNILRAAGLYQKGKKIEELFKAIETRIIRLEDGTFVPPEDIDPAGFNQLKAALDKKFGHPLPEREDLAGLGHQERYAFVYLVHEHEKLSKVILPVRGKGLWSTMFGYVALSSDLNTISGVTFYKHGETPGLGGEIEKPSWQDKWHGKKIYSEEEKPIFKVVKGRVRPGSEGEEYEVDGISGATLTMKGVSRLMTFWFGDHGFGPFLHRYQQGGLDG